MVRKLQSYEDIQNRIDLFKAQKRDAKRTKKDKDVEEDIESD